MKYGMAKNKGQTSMEEFIRAELLRLSKNVDEQGKAIAAMAISIAEMAVQLKNIPHPKARPCEFFTAHIEREKLHDEQHEDIAVVMVQVKDHLKAAEKLDDDIRREGIGVFGKIFIYVVGGLILLGIGAFIERHDSEQKQGILLKQNK